MVSLCSHFVFAHRRYKMLLRFPPMRTVMEQVPMVCWALLLPHLLHDNLVRQP